MGFNKTFNAEEKARLEQLIKEGCTVKNEIETLSEGLRDTVKAIAEEMDIKPAMLNKAISVAHKGTYYDELEKFDALDTILDTVGRKG